jgi:putative restriction endonuclease
VNFWSPSDYYTFHGKPGSPFFFKLKGARDAIGGYGFVSRFAKLPEWLAWECFGEGNGSPTLDDMQARLNDLRSRDRLTGRSGLAQIGCIVLSDAVFFPQELWVHRPSDWGRQNLRYKRYDLSTGEGLRVLRECEERRLGLLPADVEARRTVLVDSGNRYGDPVLVRQRLGQGAFRVAVTDAYQRACAVTGEHSLPVLQAAHIRPYAKEGPHEVPNGLLLRSDLHQLLDKGYVTVTPDYRLEVGSRLRSDFQNGRDYYPYHGATVAVPARATDRPAAEFLRWHNETVFLG